MKKIYSILLAITMMIVLAGCGTEGNGSELEKTTASDSAGETEAAYKETSVPYPDGTVFYSTYDADGTPVAILFDTKNTTNEHAAYEQYLYRDGLWEKQDMDSLNKVLEKENIPYMSTLDKDSSGNWYGLWTDLTGGEMTKDSVAFYEFTEKKAVKHADVMFSGDNQMYHYRLFGDGKICALYGDGSIRLQNIKDGTVENEPGTGFVRMDVAGDKIFAVGAVSENEYSVTEFDSKSGEQGNTYPVVLTNQGIAFCQDEEENAYVCTENGIFLLDEDTEKLTEVVSADNMSINALKVKGSSGVGISGIRVKDGAFYVTYLFAGENSREYKMYIYSK